MHDSILLPRAYAARHLDGRIVAIAYGALDRDLLVVADKAPARALYRALGFGRELYRYPYRRQPEEAVRTGR